MRKEERTTFTPPELLLFVEKLLDAFFIDCCPSCQLPLDWRDRISEENIKTKMEEIVLENGIVANRRCVTCGKRIRIYDIRTETCSDACKQKRYRERKKKEGGLT